MRRGMSLLVRGTFHFGEVPIMRVLCSITVLALAACTVPSTTADTKPVGPLQVAVASTDTTGVRKLCISPDSVLSGKKPCVLKADYAQVRKF